MPTCFIDEILNMKLPADTVSFDAIFDAQADECGIFTPSREAALAARA